MQALLGLAVSSLENMLDHHATAAKRLQLIEKLQKLIARKLNISIHMLPSYNEQQNLMIKISRYYSLLNYEKLCPTVNFYMPYSFLFRLDRSKGDLCQEHVDLDYQDLIRNWRSCNCCYFRYHKNRCMDEIVLAVNNIKSLSLPEIQDCSLVLGLQFAYCAEAMNLLLYGIADPKVKRIYLELRKFGLELLQQLRQLPEVETKQHRSMLFNFYNMCCGMDSVNTAVKPRPQF